MDAHTGDARTRIAGVYGELVLLQREHVPRTAWALIASVRERLTRGGVSVRENTRRMKNNTAARLLRVTWDAHEITRQAYDRDSGRA